MMEGGGALGARGSGSGGPRPMVLGISGSPRRNGNSDLLLRQVLKGARESRVPCDAVRLIDFQFQPCVGCEKCRKDKICTGLHDGMNLLYPRIIESRGLVLISPTHNYNVTAWVKAFIDRLYCFFDFDEPRPSGWSSRLAGQGRAAVVGAVCEQESREDMGFTIEGMRLPLEALGYEIIGELAVTGVFGKGRVREERDALDRAERLGSALAEAVSGPRA